MKIKLGTDPFLKIDCPTIQLKIENELSIKVGHRKFCDLS